ncbi:MAG: LysE family transporter [Chloroflexota bacterium]|nr:LysE family transporter [Chloroflexota bacterium]
MLLSFIIKAATIGFSAGITPGPLQAVFLSYAIKGGWKKALPAAFAPLFSDIPVVLVVFLILNNLPDLFLRILQVAGAGFLLYLAWDSYKAFKNYQLVQEAEDTNPMGTLAKATTMNLLGPGPWLFWSLINGPNLIQAWKISTWWGLAYVASFYGTFIISNIALIFLFSGMRQLGEQVRKALLLVSALVLAGFAIYQGLQGLAVI